jgi:F-type H+-transporting ATPase subunit b
MEILAKLGIDWKLFVAQIVNFVILLIILRRFVYRPMLAFLDERTNRIDKGLKDADLAHKKLSQMERKEKEVLDQAKKEAQKILEKAELMGKQNYEKMLIKATDDVKLLMHQSAQKMELERVKILNEAKAQLADLVILTTEKVLQEKIDAQKEGEIIKRHLKV